MLPIVLITFRETLEVLLVGGTVYAALKENKINKQKDLILGSLSGLLVSVILFIFSLYIGRQIAFDIHELGEVIEMVGYVVTGVFLYLTAILLHNKMRQIVLLSPAQLLTSSLFAVGFLTVIREGMEIIFFSLSSVVSSNIALSLFGFILGVGSATIFGYISVRYAIVKISHRMLLTISEWAIKLLALYFICKGLLELSELFF